MVLRFIRTVGEHECLNLSVCPPESPPKNPLSLGLGRSPPPADHLQVILGFPRCAHFIM